MSDPSSSPEKPAPVSAVVHHVDEPVRWDNPVPLVFVRGWCFGTTANPVVGVVIRNGDAEWQSAYGMPRPDVAAAFGGASGSGESGFSNRIPREQMAGRSLVFFAVHTDGSETVLRHVEVPVG